MFSNTIVILKNAKPENQNYMTRKKTHFSIKINDKLVEKPDIVCFE